MEGNYYFFRLKNIAETVAGKFISKFISFDKLDNAIM
jgi:hypothetical protein